MTRERTIFSDDARETLLEQKVKLVPNKSSRFFSLKMDKRTIGVGIASAIGGAMLAHLLSKVSRGRVSSKSVGERDAIELVNVHEIPPPRTD